jgi:hypothetical protein
METGRPTKYDPKYCKDIIEFFDKNPLTGFVENDKQRMRPTRLPTFAMFAMKLGVEHQTLLNWCDDNPAFLEAYNAAKELQKQFLMDLGLSGETPPASFIFVAKNITDMKDEKGIDLTSKGEQIQGFNYIKPSEKTG